MNEFRTGSALIHDGNDYYDYDGNDYYDKKYEDYKDFIDLVEEFEKYDNNWDSYGAGKIKDNLITKSKEIVNILFWDYDELPTFITPTHESILVETPTIEIELFDDNNSVFVVKEDSGDQYIDIKTDQISYYVNKYISADRYSQGR